jgi:hypothetical protein
MTHTMLAGMLLMALACWAYTWPWRWCAHVA